MTHKLSLTLLLFAGIWFSAVSQKKYTPKQIEALKAEVSSIVEANHKQSQVMVDKNIQFCRVGFSGGGIFQIPHWHLGETRI
jgi:aminobenzoyl-glutamate utilization protein B